VFNTSNCLIELSDFFSNYNFQCDLTYNKVNFSIRTNKVNYFENEAIGVYIYPNNITLNLTYGNQTKTAVNYTVFNATRYQNKIIAINNGEEVSSLINVNDQTNLTFFVDLGVLFLVSYLSINIAKHYGRKI